MEGEGNDRGLEVSRPWVWVESCPLESPGSLAVVTWWEVSLRRGMGPEPPLTLPCETCSHEGPHPQGKGRLVAGGDDPGAYLFCPGGRGGHQCP